MSFEAAAMAQEARSIFVDLHDKDRKSFTYAKIGQIINSVTHRKMDSSAARRFLLGDSDRPTVFSVPEAANVLQAAKMVQAEFEKSLKNPFRGNQDLPAVKIDFLKSVSLRIDIPVSPELFNKLQGDPALRDFIRETVESALSFADRMTGLKPD